MVPKHTVNMEIDGSTSSPSSTSFGGRPAPGDRRRIPVAGSSSDAAFARPHLARSPPPPTAGPSGSCPLSFLDALAGPMQAAAAEDRSLPPTPRSPSPTCSPPSSPKRQKGADSKAGAPASSGTEPTLEDDLETRAAALGLNEVSTALMEPPRAR